MQPWHVEGDYNRPIPRRIIEDAGLPRGSCAVHKKGGGHAYFPPKKKDASPAMNSYQDFMRQNHAQVTLSRRAYWRTRVSIEHALWRCLGASKSHLVSSTPQQRRLPFLKNCPPVKQSWSSMFTFQWAQSTLAQNYRLPKQPEESNPQTGFVPR
jgi:hypothetical protein